jgi:hypothetical protein
MPKRGLCDMAGADITRACFFEADPQAALLRRMLVEGVGTILLMLVLTGTALVIQQSSASCSPRRPSPSLIRNQQRKSLCRKPARRVSDDDVNTAAIEAVGISDREPRAGGGSRHGSRGLHL